jgi:hypothetical protein
MKAIMIGATFSALLAGTASAQASPTMPDGSQPQVPLKPVFGYMPVGTASLDRVRFNSLVLESRPTSVAAQERRTRMERAERLAALVNLGRCHDARDTALAENDQPMADRIVAVCRGEH